MPKIDAKLLQAIAKKTGLGQAQIYKRITKTASAELLPRHLAAIKLAADLGITINRYADADSLAELRRAGSPVVPPQANPQTVATTPRKVPNRKSASVSRRAPPNQVFVVHGRDMVSRDSVFQFLRALGIKPIEWTTAIRMTKKPSPYIGDILDAAFSNARGVVVLLTPDDRAILRDDLITHNDPPFERALTGQARPNVLFECGMAFSSHPDRTVLVQLGKIRPFSDTAGRHILNLADSAEKRQEFATKLQNAGCDVDTTGTDWLSAGDFTDPDMRTPKARRK